MDFHWQVISIFLSFTLPITSTQWRLYLWYRMCGAHGRGSVRVGRGSIRVGRGTFCESAHLLRVAMLTGAKGMIAHVRFTD